MGPGTKSQTEALWFKVPHGVSHGTGVSILGQVGHGRHLIHDGDISCMGPETVVHGDKGQALPAAEEGLS